jgi:uncharacterized flavoprotein (TIGR03862 family)
MLSETCDALVIGGGPAGLRAAELLSASGAKVILADRMPSAGRKFLVAGRGGLNLTHSEPLEDFVRRYGEPQARWHDLLAGFSPEDLRGWANDLGIETFIGTSRRVFPVGKQAAPLLRRWIERLRKQGVVFRLRHRFAAFRAAKSGGWEIDFATPDGPVSFTARAVIFALGGASWPQTGSDGAWTQSFTAAGLPLVPLTAANVGYEGNWPKNFLAQAEGLPLKNIVVRSGGEEAAGELLITKYGIEGGALYQLGRVLRTQARPLIEIDLKPSFSPEQLAKKLRHTPWQEDSLDRATVAWKLGPVARALLEISVVVDKDEELVRLAKALPLALERPRPIAEAISTAGGVAWDALDEDLMLRGHPGLFCAGEMISWDAPTGGYLLQGCFATGTRAARGALKILGKRTPAEKLIRP